MAKSSNTSFATIYNIFLSRVTADMYMELTELDTYQLLQELLINAGFDVTYNQYDRDLCVKFKDNSGFWADR